MYFFLLAFLSSMVWYLLYEINLTKTKKKFTEIIKTLEDEKVEILREAEGLRVKEQFYSQISLQLERKNEEITKLSSEIASLKTELKLKKS